MWWLRPVGGTWVMTLTSDWTEEDQLKNGQPPGLRPQLQEGNAVVWRRVLTPACVSVSPFQRPAPCIWASNLQPLPVAGEGSNLNPRMVSTITEDDNIVAHEHIGIQAETGSRGRLLILLKDIWTWQSYLKYSAITCTTTQLHLWTKQLTVDHKVLDQLQADSDL